MCTCAMTSCRLFFSSIAAISNCFASRCCKRPSAVSSHTQRRMPDARGWPSSARWLRLRSATRAVSPRLRGLATACAMCGTDSASPEGLEISPDSSKDERGAYGGREQMSHFLARISAGHDVSTNETDMGKLVTSTEASGMCQSSPWSQAKGKKYSQDGRRAKKIKVSCRSHELSLRADRSVRAAHAESRIMSLAPAAVLARRWNSVYQHCESTK